MICCEAWISRTQQSPGWPSGPAVSDTSSLPCPAVIPDGGVPLQIPAHQFIITTSNHPQLAVGRGRLGGDGVIYIPPPRYLHLHLQPLLHFFSSSIFGPSPEMKNPPPPPTHISSFPDWFCCCEQTNRPFELLLKKNPAAHLILLPREVAPPEGC